MSDFNSDGESRDYVTLFIRLCNCAGPQPSKTSARADEHDKECPYRLEVNEGGDSGERE